MRVCVCASSDQRVLTHSFRSFAHYRMSANCEHIIQIFIIECVALFICLYSSNITMAGKKSLLHARPSTALTLTPTVSISLSLSSWRCWRASKWERKCVWVVVVRGWIFCRWLKVWAECFFLSFSAIEVVFIVRTCDCIWVHQWHYAGNGKKTPVSNSRSSFDNTIARPVYTNASHLFSIYCVNTLCQIKVHYLFIKALSMK